MCGVTVCGANGRMETNDPEGIAVSESESVSVGAARLPSDLLDCGGFGRFLAENQCDGVVSILDGGLFEGFVVAEETEGARSGRRGVTKSKERAGHPLGSARVATKPWAKTTVHDDRSGGDDGRVRRPGGSDVVRTVMRTAFFLRVGCAALLLVGAGGAASAFDPDGMSSEDADSLPNVQALAPVPAPGRLGGGAAVLSPAQTSLSAPPGVSVKLLPGPIVAPNASVSAEDAFRNGTRLYYAGDRKAAMEQLRRAAERGHPIAQWKLGKIYETGDGVPVNDAKAFEFYREVIDNHSDDARGTPQAAFVASAFVALGSYYLKGVENAAIRPNVDRARELYTYAASIFGDTEAQYRLGRLYLEASGEERDPRQAARWLTVAARKGHCGAQAMLGQLLFTGDEGFPRRPVQGLMWLTVARANAGAATGEDWIREVQEQVFSVASESERRRGVADAQDWIAKAGNN